MFSCKKAEDRGCLKSTGKMTELTYSIDSVQEFKLYKGIVYRFYQDDRREVIIKGGKNVIKFINIESINYVTAIRNLNSCDFLRDYDDKITVEIHYPHYNNIYAEPTEPMLFVDTLKGDFTNIELRNGGESLDLNVDIKIIQLSVSYGTGSININGKANLAKLGIQNLGRINALNLSAPNVSIYQGSATDLLVNFENSNVSVGFNGSGDVRYVGTPNSLNIFGQGDGEVITY